MRKREDWRFELVDRALRRSAASKHGVAVEGPALVPVRVIASTAPSARQSNAPGALEVVLPDGTRLRFPRDVSSAFLVEVVTALRTSTC